RSNAAWSSDAIGWCWRARSTKGIVSVIELCGPSICTAWAVSNRRRSRQAAAQLLERSVYPPVHGRAGLAGELRNLRQRQIGAIAQGHGFALLSRQRFKRPTQLVALLDQIHGVGTTSDRLHRSFDGSRLRRLAAGAIAQHV